MVIHALDHYLCPVDLICWSRINYYWFDLTVWSLQKRCCYSGFQCSCLVRCRHYSLSWFLVREKGHKCLSFEFGECIWAASPSADASEVSHFSFVLGCSWVRLNLSYRLGRHECSDFLSSWWLRCFSNAATHMGWPQSCSCSWCRLSRWAHSVWGCFIRALSMSWFAAFAWVCWYFGSFKTSKSCILRHLLNCSQLSQFVQQAWWHGLSAAWASSGSDWTMAAYAASSMASSAWPSQIWACSIMKNFCAGAKTSCWLMDH